MQRGSAWMVKKRIKQICNSNSYWCSSCKGKNGIFMFFKQTLLHIIMHFKQGQNGASLGVKMKWNDTVLTWKSVEILDPTRHGVGFGYTVMFVLLANNTKIKQTLTCKKEAPWSWVLWFYLLYSHSSNYSSSSHQYGLISAITLLSSSCFWFNLYS